MKSSRVLATAALSLLLALGSATALLAAEKKLSPVTIPAATPVKPGLQQPVQPMLPDLVAGVPHHYTGTTTCSTLGWVMWNKGTAPLPDKAYAATSQEGGVVIRIFKMNPYMQVVKNVMLKDVDPLKKIKPVNGTLDAGPVSLGAAFAIPCSSDANNNQWGKFQVRLDADQTLNELPPDDNNSFVKVVPCWCP
jgi:hypothetical protein